MLTQSTFPIMDGTKDYNFIGNIESRDIFSEESDVIVCDGFTGNIMLKEMEAFTRLLRKEVMKMNTSKDLITKIMEELQY